MRMMTDCKVNGEGFPQRTYKENIGIIEGIWEILPAQEGGPVSMAQHSSPHSNKIFLRGIFHQHTYMAPSVANHLF